MAHPFFRGRTPDGRGPGPALPGTSAARGDYPGNYNIIAPQLRAFAVLYWPALPMWCSPRDARKTGAVGRGCTRYCPDACKSLSSESPRCGLDGRTLFSNFKIVKWNFNSERCNLCPTAPSLRTERPGNSLDGHLHTSGTFQVQAGPHEREARLAGAWRATSRENRSAAPLPRGGASSIDAVFRSSAQRKGDRRAVVQ